VAAAAAAVRLLLHHKGGSAHARNIACLALRSASPLPSPFLFDFFALLRVQPGQQNTPTKSTKDPIGVYPSPHGEGAGGTFDFSVSFSFISLYLIV